MKSFHDRREWDGANGAIHDRDTPYLLIQLGSRLGLFEFLPEAELAGPFEAFARSLPHYGKGPAESYQALGGVKGATLINPFTGRPDRHLSQHRNVAAVARQLTLLDSQKTPDYRP